MSASMWKQFLSKLPRKSLKSDTGTGADCAPAPYGTLNGSANGDIACPNHPAGVGGGVGSNDPTFRSPATTAANGVKRTSAAVFPSNEAVEPSLSFKDVPSQDKQGLFISKLNLCCAVFDFSDMGKDVAEKDAKRRALFELVEHVGSGTAKLGEPAVALCCRMFEANLFRPLPTHCRPGSAASAAGGGGGGENDVDEPLFDPAWSHLQVVYELLLKFIASKELDAKMAKKYVDHAFILRLLDLFDSEDPRERDCLKTILHRIYGKFMVHRPFIRKSVSNIFYRFVFETERHNGVAELLEVFGSVISGFALPLKEEHKMFLWRALIPLHKPKMVGIYLQQLTYCVIQFIEKEPKLVSTVIRGLLKYWPVTNSQKEVMFLGELEEVLESTNLVEFQKVMVPMFRRIGYCLNSSHFQVAERALFLWNNDHVINLIAQNRHVILPIIFPALERNTRNHWNQAVLNVTMNVRKIFFDMDEELFTSCQKKFEEEEAGRTALEEKRKVAWERLEYAASFQPVNIRTPAIVTPMAPPLLIANHG